MPPTKWNEACGECLHEQGYHHDHGKGANEECELCLCPRFVPSGKPATYDTKEETSGSRTKEELAPRR